VLPSSIDLKLYPWIAAVICIVSTFQWLRDIYKTS
jgi:hypothetical protein